MRRFLLITILIALFNTSQSQSLSFTCPRDTILGCNAACFTLKGRFPDIRALGTDYTVKNVTSTSGCFPYVTPDAPGTSTNLTIDDRYTSVITLPFPFLFYGLPYTSLIASTNGFVSFDISKAGLFSHYSILNNGGVLSPTTGTPENLPSLLYDAALIMGPYHDLDPSVTTSPTRQIKYDIVGAAPNRRWVLSFYKVPLFSCTTLFENTHQIIIYESTGLIEVKIIDKQICTAWNIGHSMIGLLSFDKLKGIMAPGRAASDAPWGSIGMSETWRFIPTGGAPLYRGVQLLNSAGVVVATGDTTRIDVNTFEATFPNVCPPAGTSLFVIKTTYQKIDDPLTTTFSLDTINIIRQATLPVTTALTPTTCGNSTGTITVTVAGGVAPYQYSVDGGALQASNVFTGLAAGTHTILAQDNAGCNNTVTVTVTSLSSLPGTVTSVIGTTCPGVNNGSITVQPTAGAAPFSYSLDGGPSQLSNTFTSVAAGSHTIVFTDANACTGSVTTTVIAGTPIQSTAVTIGASCTGANNGSTTVTATTGSGPYMYSIDGGPFQASGTFTNLTPGSHTVTIRDINNCTGTKSVFISSGSGITSTQTNTLTSCPTVNNGTITITPTNGSAPYTYSINAGPFQVSNIFTGLAPGTHTITIKDNNNCTGTRTVIITSGTNIAGTTSSTNASCPGANNGTITVIPVTGTAPYTYTIDGGPSQISPVFSGVIPGLHTLGLTDVSGCSATVSVTITAGTGISGSATSTGTSCPGVNNGMVTVTSSSGVAPFTYSIDGGSTQPSNIFTNVASGIHSIILTDAGGCSTTVSVTVAAGPAISGTASTTATSCPGVNTGTATVNTVGGSAPYSYSIDGGTSQASNTFPGLAAGPHVLSFTNASGCTGTVSVTVASGTIITGTASSTATSCPGVNNGTATVNTVGGPAPYSYSIDGGGSQASNIFAGLTAGPHVLSFTNASGCTGTVSVTVASGAIITGTASSTATSCPGVNNGTATVNTVAGPAPYSYSIDGGSSQASNTFPGLAAGPHLLSFSNASGCTGTVSVTVVSGTAITGAASSTATSCPGVNNGTATVNTVAGPAPYSYSIDGGSSQASNVFAGLTAGPHVLSFTNASGCTGTVSVTVASGAIITGTASSTATSCPGVNNGTATVNTVAGPAPYSYSIDGGSSQASNVFAGLTAGPHVLSFTNASGCTGTVSVTVASGAIITGTASSTATSCPGVNNGTATVNTVAGPAPYSYSIDGGSSQASNTFPGLVAGPHTISFTNGSGCSGSTAITVAQGAPLTGTATSTNTSCPTVNNGTVTALPSSGGAPYQYSINGGSTFQPLATFTGLSPNTYIIIIKDNAGCTGTVSATVTAGSNITSVIVITQPVCANINDGIITINPGTGTAPFQYSLNGSLFQLSNIFPGLAPGVYTIAIKDAIGCTGTNTATLITNSPLATSVSMIMPLCNGNANGSITFTATGGVAPYQYSNNGGISYQGSGTFTGLSSGLHTIRIKDNAGCIKDTTVTLNQPTLLSASAVSTIATCAGNDAVITITGNGGTTAYQYSIDGISYQSTNNITAPAVGPYNNIKVKDANGCIATTNTLITYTDNMFVDAGPDTTICAEQTIVLQPLTNPQTNIFRWTPVTAINDPAIKNPAVTPLSTIKYYLNASWGACSHTDSVTVTVKKKPIANAGPDVTICNNDSTILTGSATNLSGTVNYVWTPSSSVRDDSSYTTIVVPKTTQVYVLTVTDNYGCNYSVTDQVKVTVQPPVPAFAGKDSIAVKGTPHQLRATGGSQYLWSPGATLNNPLSQNPLATLFNDTKFTVIVTDVAGCIGYDTIFIKVYNGPTYYTPNAFTPNGDGLNDVFRAIPVGITKTDYFRIFNRYGELVFETNQWLKGWDGTYKGKRQPMGLYVWIIKGTDKLGSTVEMKGTVMLIQ